MGFSGQYVAQFFCDCCGISLGGVVQPSKEEAIKAVQNSNRWQLLESGAILCEKCKDKAYPELIAIENRLGSTWNGKPHPIDIIKPEKQTEPVFHTIKVVCQKCGHYISGCHCDHFGDQCMHLNISEFDHNGIADCFNCKRKINRDREVVWL